MNESLLFIIGSVIIGAIWGCVPLLYNNYKRKKAEDAEIKQLQKAKTEIAPLEKYPDSPKPIGELTINEIKAIEAKITNDIQTIIKECPYDFTLIIQENYWANKLADGSKYEVWVSINTNKYD